MAWNEDILSELPAPNSEEPLSLRQDIADELKDHLQCSTHREALSQSDPERIEQRIIARFGNPKKIARQLWFEAMKEKLMMQKVTLALVSVVAVGSLAACGLMWSLAHDFQAASTELLTQSREANTELLKQNQEMMQRLGALGKKEPEAPNLMEWVPLKIHAIQDDENKTPGLGFQVKVYGPAIIETQAVFLDEETDKSGIADFGFVRPGSYSITVTTPLGDQQIRSVIVKPGSPHLEEFVAPDDAPEEHLVKPVFHWPNELKDQNIAALIPFERFSTSVIRGQTWKNERESFLLFRPDGRFAMYQTVTSHPPGSNTSRPKGEGYLFTEVFRFDSKPDVYKEAFSFRGQSARFYRLTFVELDQEAPFPEDGDMLDLHFLHALEPSLGRDRSFDIHFYVQAQVQPAAEIAQIWPIEPNFRMQVDLSRLMPLIKQYPQFPAVYVTKAMTIFSIRDEDGNMELTKEEAGESSSLNKITTWPISFQGYLEHWIKTEGS